MYILYSIDIVYIYIYICVYIYTNNTNTITKHVLLAPTRRLVRC